MTRITSVFAWIAMSALMLSGCVTTSTGPVKRAADVDTQVQDHIQLGLGYIGSGNRDSARFHLLKAMELDKRSPGAHNGMALLYQMEKEIALAEEHYQRALALDTGFSQARNNYGVFLYRQERFEEAYQQFRVAARDTAYERRPQVFVSLGVIARQLGKNEEARGYWEKAIALDRRLPAAYLELADSYYQSGDYPTSKAMLSSYEKLAKASPRSLWLAVRLERIFGNRDAESSKGLALEKLYPYSQENLEYQNWLKDDRKQ